MTPMNLELRSFFGFTGRIGRLEYFVKGILVNLPVGLVFSATFLFHTNQALIIVLGIVGIILLIATIASSISLVVRRINDLGLPHWTFILVFIPFVNFLFTLYLLLAPGVPAAQSETYEDLTDDEIQNDSPQDPAIQ